MNPLIQKRIDTLGRQIDAVETRLTSMADREDAHLAEKEKIQADQWRSKKELTTLNRLAEDYDDLAGRAEAYENERAALRESLTDILTRTRALRAEYES